jgi:hypothetical protein
MAPSARRVHACHPRSSRSTDSPRRPVRGSAGVAGTAGGQVGLGEKAQGGAARAPAISATGSRSAIEERDRVTGPAGDRVRRAEDRGRDRLQRREVATVACLEGISLQEPPFEDWLRTERERLRELAPRGDLPGRARPPSSTSWRPSGGNAWRSVTSACRGL